MYQPIGAIWNRMWHESLATYGDDHACRATPVRRLGRHTRAASSGPGLGSVLGSFIHVRGRSPVVTRIVFARLADAGGRR